jgi:signal transduction histidine kinase
VALYRIAQEALNNLAKHARAQHATVSLRYSSTATRSVTQTRVKVELNVADDGRGFNPADIRPGHFGLRIMQERADKIGATFQVTSEPGQGTRIGVVWEGTIDA